MIPKIGKDFTCSDEHHLLTAGDTSYHYNVDGFLPEKIEGEDVRIYEYSSHGELLQADLPDGRVIEYIHDLLGRRITNANIINDTNSDLYITF